MNNLQLPTIAFHGPTDYSMAHAEVIFPDGTTASVEYSNTLYDYIREVVWWCDFPMTVRTRAMASSPTFIFRPGANGALNESVLEAKYCGRSDETRVRAYVYLWAIKVLRTAMLCGFDLCKRLFEIEAELVRLGVEDWDAAYENADSEEGEQ